jgi:protein gp37
MRPSHQLICNTSRLDREDNCYALTLAKRLKAMGSAKYQTDGDPRTSGPGFGVALHDGDLSLPLRWREPGSFSSTR